MSRPDPSRSCPPDSPPAAPLPEVLTVREAAAHLRVNVKTVYAEIAANRIRVIRLGRTVRVPRAVIAALCAGSPAK
jgi:excisionase family DNA binding protein